MIDSGSRTALMVAAYRARATARPEPICRDVWAAALAGEAGAALAHALDRHVANMELWIALRTAWIDRQVAGALAAGWDQIVLLGAGFDTRAARLGRAGALFFEVDHPATQRDKRARLAELDGYPVAAARYVACDLERGDDLVEALESGGLARDRRALVVWEGVTAYLTEASVRATAARIASGLAPASVLLFDYLGARFVEGQTRRAGDDAVRAEVSALGEPFCWGTADPLPLLHACGFRHVLTLTFDQLALALTGTYDRAREFRFQGVCAASCATEMLTAAW